MSTRCMIEVKSPYTHAQVYRHGDGYPEGVLADVKVLLRHTDRTPTDDPEYFLACLVFACKLGLSNMGSFDTGYGIATPGKVHGDEAYWYVFEGNKLTIRQGKYNEQDYSKDKTWHDIFTGTLEQGYEKYKIDNKGCHIKEAQLKRIETKKGA